jgi:hypothetical protein
MDDAALPVNRARHVTLRDVARLGSARGRLDLLGLLDAGRVGARLFGHVHRAAGEQDRARRGGGQFCEGHLYRHGLVSRFSRRGEPAGGSGGNMPL